MKKIFSLIKVDLNTSYGLSSISHSLKSKKDPWQIVIFSIAMLSILPSYFLTLKALNGMFNIYSEIGQKSMFLLSGFLISQSLVFFFGLLYVMSKYYFSNDLNHLVPLPIKASYILGSKFVTLMISEYLTSLPIIFPFVYIYGTKGGEGVLYWLYSILLILTLPIIPLVLASIVVMLFMKYTNIGKMKDLIRVIGAVIFIGVIIYIQLKIQDIAQRSLMNENLLFELIKDSNLLVKKLGLAFPPSMWAVLSLSNYMDVRGFYYLLIFIGVGIVAFIAMMLLSEKVFYSGLIGNIEVSAYKGKGGKKLSISNLSRQGKPYMALAKKELIMLFKTPVYLLNAVGGVIILPILLPVMTGGDDGIELILKSISVNQEVIALLGIAFVVSLGILNSIGVTTFSREGKNIWIQRVLPIKVQDQIKGRVLSSLVVQSLGIIALIISLMFIIELEIKTMLLIGVIGMLGSITMTQLGMVIDIIRPYLTWNNPQRAMKQNLNVLIGLGVGTIYLGCIGYLTFISIGKININIMFLCLSLIFVLSSLILYKILGKLIVKQFRDLE